MPIRDENREIIRREIENRESRNDSRNEFAKSISNYLKVLKYRKKKEKRKGIFCVMEYCHLMLQFVWSTVAQMFKLSLSCLTGLHFHVWHIL